MSKTFHEFSPYRHYPFDENKVRTIFDKYLLSPTEVIVILGCKDGQVIATLVGTLSQLFFSPTNVAGEIIWWVDPEYRRTGIGFKMHEAFEFWSKQVGADVLQCVQTEETTALVKFYTGNGYHLAESIYVKDIK
jgi:GNAT superfamily N-acetyltransferase